MQRHPVASEEVAGQPCVTGAGRHGAPGIRRDRKNKYQGTCQGFSKDCRPCTLERGQLCPIWACGLDTALACAGWQWGEIRVAWCRVRLEFNSSVSGYMHVCRRAPFHTHIFCARAPVQKHAVRMSSTHVVYAHHMARYVCTPWTWSQTYKYILRFR